MSTAALALPRTSGIFLRPDRATQWQLMWRRFRRHHMAMLGLGILGLLLLIAVFAEIIAPYEPSQRSIRYLSGEPTGVHFFDNDGSFHARPFVYARIIKRDPVTLRAVPTVDLQTERCRT